MNGLQGALQAAADGPPALSDANTADLAAAPAPAGATGRGRRGGGLVPQRCGAQAVTRITIDA